MIITSKFWLIRKGSTYKHYRYMGLDHKIPNEFQDPLCSTKALRCYLGPYTCCRHILEREISPNRNRVSGASDPSMADIIFHFWSYLHYPNILLLDPNNLFENKYRVFEDYFMKYSYKT